MDPLLALGIPVLACGGVAYFLRFQRERVSERLRRVALRRKGRVVQGPWYLYPRLVVEVEGTEIQISGMHGSDGSGTCTFAWVGCADYPEIDLVVERMADRAGFLERLGWKPTDTGDASFDAAFHMKTADAEGARTILDEGVRRALLALDTRLRARVRVGTAPTYRDGRRRFGEEEPRLDVSIHALPPTVEDVERLLDVAALVHARLLWTAARASA